MRPSRYTQRGAGALLLSASLCVLCSCSPWFAHRQPVIAPAADRALTALPDGVAAAPLPDHWWRLYNDPELDRLVQEALAHNRDLATAQAHVQAMLAGISERNAARWPSSQLSAGASYGRSADDQTLASATQTRAPNQWEFNPGLELSYQLDVWGQVQHSIEQAQAQADAAQAAEDLMRTTVAAQATRAYATACAYAARASVQRQSVQLLQHSLQLTERQRRGGIATQLEPTRVRALLGETQAQLPMLEARRQAALFELATLTGRSTLRRGDAGASCTAIPQLASALPSGDGWALIARRADVRQAQRELQAASLQVDIAQADLYPKVTFGASLSSSSHRIGQLGDSQSVMFAVGPLISWQFPNWQANRARVREAQAIEQGHTAHFEASVLMALQQVHQALALYDGERQRHTALAQALADSRSAYNLAQLNYQAGALDFLDVLDSEREMVRLQATVADADAQLIDRQVSLFQALGGGWQHAAATTPATPAQPDGNPS